MKRVFASGDSAQVGLRRSVLEAAHLASEYRRRDSYFELFTPSLGADELWVEDSDYDEAATLIAESELVEA